MSVEMYLKTSITKFSMFVVEYENERGYKCEADFHELKTCLNYLLTEKRFSYSPITIKKVSKYWKDPFTLDVLCNEEFTLQERAEIDAYKTNADSVINYDF